MAGQPRDLLTMLADRGEEAISKLADTPGADRLLGVAQSLRERLDEMQKKVRGIDQLEARVGALERRLDELGKKVRGIDDLERRVGKLEKELASVKRAQKAKTPPAG